MTEQEMLALHQSGISAKDIAAQAGLKYHAVWQALKRQGAEFVHRGRPPSPETLEAIRLYESGLQAKEVCERTGVQRSTLYQALRVKGKPKHQPITVKRFTNAEKADIADAYQSGESAYSIGQRYGRDQVVIIQALKRAKVYVPNRRGAKPMKRFDDDERQRITEMYRQGLSTTEIGEEVGRHGAVVQRELQRLGEWEAEDPACAVWESPVIQLWCCGFGTQAIAAQLGIRSNTAGYILRKHGLSPGRPDYSHNERFWFDWTPISAYWLGFLLADGCIIDRGSSHALQVTLQERDRGHLETFLADYEATNPIRETTKSTWKKQYRLVTTKVTLTDAEADHLSRFGLVPNKTYGLDLSCLTALPDRLIRDAIRGYVDGDGTVYSPTSRSDCSVSVCGTEASARFCQTVLSQAGAAGTIKHRDTLNGLWFCTWSSSSAAIAAQFLYQEAVRSLQRKAKKAATVMDKWRSPKKAGPRTRRDPTPVVY